MHTVKMRCGGKGRRLDNAHLANEIVRLLESYSYGWMDVDEPTVRWTPAGRTALVDLATQEQADTLLDLNGSWISIKPGGPKLKVRTFA